MPCADTEVSSLEHTTSKFASNHNERSHDNRNDLCSPFCTCNCCSVQILTNFPTFTASFPVVSEIIKIQLPTYKSIANSNYFGSIWQPPQIV